MFILPNITIGILITFSNEYSWLIETYSQARLAIHHINNDPNILPNTTMAYQVYNTDGDGTVSLEGVLRLKDEVVAFVGPAYSAACDPPARLASILELPILSPGSTSAELVDKSSYPYFMRTISSSDQEFQMVADAIKTIFNWDQVLVLTSADDWGLTNFQAFNEQCEQIGISASAVYYTSETSWSIDTAMYSILSTQNRIIINMAYDYDQTQIFDTAKELGVLDDYVWIVLADFVSDDLRGTRNDLSGLFISDRVSQDVGYNSSIRDYLNEHWAQDTTIYNCTRDGWPFNATQLFSPSAPFWDTDDACVGDGKPDFWGSYAYDTVWFIAKAIDTMVRRGDDPRNGFSLREELLVTSIDGYTGTLKIDPESQDRLNEYYILNKNSSGQNNIVIVTTENFNSSTDCLQTKCVELIGNVTWPSDITEYPPNDIIDISCEPGEYLDDTSKTCQPCEVGYYSSTSGSDQCLPCPMGKFATDSIQDRDNSGIVSGASACANCTAGYFSNQNASVVCSVCSGTNTWSREGSSACDLCEEDSYLTDDGTCSDCPRGASCTGVGDRRLETLAAKSKFMRYSISSSSFYKCLFGRRACPGGTEVGDMACATGYNGARCAACGKSFYKRLKKCKKCGDENEQVLSFLFYIVVMLLFTYLVLMLLYNPPRFFRKAMTEVEGSGGPSDVLCAMKRSTSQEDDSNTQEEFPILTGIIIKGKAIVTMYQIIGNIPNAAHLRFPSSYEVLERISHLSSLSLFRLVPSRCLFKLSDSDNFVWDLIITTLAPIAFLLVLFCIYIIKRHADQRLKKDEARNDKILYGQIALLVVHFSLTICSTTTFSVFLCDEYDVGSNKKESYLRAAPSIRCGDSRRWRGLIRPYAILMIFVWPVGCTLIYSMLLWYCEPLLNPSQESWITTFRRRAGANRLRDSCLINVAQSASHQREVAATRDEQLRNETHEASVLALSIRTIWIDFAPQYYYFEVIDVLRRIIISAIISLVSPGRPLQLIAACLSSLFFAEINMHLKPYLYDEDNFVASICSFATAFTFFTTLCLRIRAIGRHILAIIFILCAVTPFLAILYVIRTFFYTKCLTSSEDAQITQFMAKLESQQQQRQQNEESKSVTNNLPPSRQAPSGASQLFHSCSEDDLESRSPSAQIITPPSSTMITHLNHTNTKTSQKPLHNSMDSPVSLSIENAQVEESPPDDEMILDEEFIY